jgi:hypothetical protein
VLDLSAQAAADPDFLLRRHHVDAWQEDHGNCPKTAGCCTGSAGAGRRAEVPHDGHTPRSRDGLRTVARRGDAAAGHLCGDLRHGRWSRRDVRGPAISVSLVLPRREQVRSDPRRNLRLLPVGSRPDRVSVAYRPGSGSPARVLALVEHP